VRSSAPQRSPRRSTSRVQVPRRDPRQVELFRTSFIEPCKPTLRQRAPSGPRWQFEIKHDGYRAQCHLHAGEVRIYTKNGHDIAMRLPSISAALVALPVDDAVIDGEAVMIGPDGITDFFALHAAVSAKSAPAALLYAFDLLHLNGQDLRSLPLDERRLLLEDLLLYVPDPLRFSEHVLGDGPDVARAACELGLEGIVAKVRDAPYRSGRSETWLKIKCTKTAEFVVTGFEPDGRTGVRSLEIAERIGSKLEPAGSVGSGLTAQTSQDIRRALDDSREVVVEVEFRGRTPTGGLRHPAIKGFRTG
jgi:bifunctional non-homologous end joining protein LigD